MTNTDINSLSPLSNEVPMTSFSSGKRLNKRFHEAGPCEGPGCTNTVPAGKLYNHHVHVYCSHDCRRRAKNLRRKHHKKYLGTCEYCQGPILSNGNTQAIHRFCSLEHYRASEADRIMLPAGPLRELLEDYTRYTSHYADNTLPCVKTNLARCARYLFQERGIERWEDVRPLAISKFIHHEKKRGIKSTNTIGHLSTFFNWLIAERDLDIRNPVIRKFHKQQSSQNDPRPLTDNEVSSLRKILVDFGDTALSLAFAIGEECGLRAGETGNIRVEDVDAVHCTIRVRLPTKNGVERTVPYHDKVAHCLALWMPLRNAACRHDHLLHGRRNAPWRTHALDILFRRVFSQVSVTVDKFTYHRLRHTWATRLFNGGMDLGVLQDLGGWLCMATLQVYVRVKTETINRQYQQAYENLKQRQQEPVEEIMSMERFVEMEIHNETTTL
jgi:site-specific recombinase XerD